MEIWKDIKGYEGLYQISNKGRVKSLNYRRTGKEKILISSDDGKGYLCVKLCKNNKIKNHKIHRLVAQAFLPNPDNLPEVNHQDTNTSNNCVENLEWCTHAYNMHYSVFKKIICIETGKIFNGSKDVIDRMFDGKGSSSTIRDHLRGRTKSCFGYHFKFIDE